MAILKLKTDIVQGITTTEGVIAANGDYTPGTETAGEQIPCDAVPNGQARTITLDNGEKYQYDYTVYLKPNCPEFKYGQRVKLTKSNGEVKEGVCHGFHRYQHQAKMWL